MKTANKTQYIVAYLLQTQTRNLTFSVHIQMTKSHKCVALTELQYIRNSVFSSTVFIKTWSQSSKFKCPPHKVRQSSGRSSDRFMNSHSSFRGGWDGRTPEQYQVVECWNHSILLPVLSPQDTNPVHTTWWGKIKHMINKRRIGNLIEPETSKNVPESCIDVRLGGSFPTCMVNEKCTY